MGFYQDYRAGIKFTPKSATVKAQGFQLTINHVDYVDSVMDGITDEHDKLLGWGQFTLPASERAAFIEYYGGLEMLPEPFGDVAAGHEWNEGEDHEVNSGDMFIFYVNYLINTKKKPSIEVKGEHIFWFIHDFFHAVHDVSGSYFECGPRRELERLQQAYEVIKTKKLGMSHDYVMTIVKAFNDRNWGCYDSWKRFSDKITSDSIKTQRDGEI